MNDLSLKITLKSGETRIFPLRPLASEYFQGSSWHEFLMPSISTLNNIHLEQFTKTEYGNAWEFVQCAYVEGKETSGELDLDEDEQLDRVHYSWEILLDGKPASYAEVDQSLNCDYWLHIESSRQTEINSIPLDKGQWAIDSEGKYYLDETVNVLSLADGIYEAADVDVENGTEENGTHYGKVLEAIKPILERKTEFFKTTIDGIKYTFTLSRTKEA